MMLQDNAITGKTKYGTPQIKSRAKYVDPPPKPTLEYNTDVAKNNIGNICMVNYPTPKQCKSI